ncbi:hypothetical protein BJ741DRAFT_699435 [Chytriomyces cf. hyalinus JEL632]|nr:hypothetical protein BJ741DRAFT_699435 [Chytriomyces cf. hyalinus JEL632]
MALEMYLQQGRAWHNCRTSVRSTKDAIWSRISGGMDSSVRFVSFEGTVWIDGPRTFQAAYMEMNVNGLERIRLYLRKYMSLRDNTLNSFPATLNKWTSLTSILLSDSGLVGKIPESIKHLRNLKELVLSCNRFDGTEIPASIMELAHLEVLMLNGCSGVCPVSGNSEAALLAEHYNQLIGMDGAEYIWSIWSRDQRRDQRWRASNNTQ